MNLDLLSDEGHMRRGRPFVHGLIVLLALATLLIRFEPVSAQDRVPIEIVPVLGHSAPVKSVAFSPDGARVLSGSSDLKLWDAATGALIRTFEASGSVYSVAFSPDGARVLSGSWDNTIKLWDGATG